MTTQHTPGPWSISGQADDWSVMSPTGMKYSGWPNFGRIEIARVQCSPEKIEEARANLCLIAAAPELLEVLQLDVTFHSRHSVWDSIEEFRAVGYRGPAESNQMRQFLLEKKQAAIAKAEKGGSL